MVTTATNSRSSRLINWTLWWLTCSLLRTLSNSSTTLLTALEGVVGGPLGNPFEDFQFGVEGGLVGALCDQGGNGIGGHYNPSGNCSKTI